MYVYRPTHLPALSDYATDLLYAYIRYHGTLVQNSRKRLHVTYAEQVFCDFSTRRASFWIFVSLHFVRFRDQSV